MSLSQGWATPSPATFVAKEFTSAIEIQEATETGVPIKMGHHLDVSFSVTSKEMSLDIKDFSKQFLVPAMQAFNDKIVTRLLCRLLSTRLWMQAHCSTPQRLLWATDDLCSTR